MPTGKYIRKVAPYKFPHIVRPIIIPVGPSIAYVPLTRGQFAVIEIDDIPLVQGRNISAGWSTNNGDYYAYVSIVRDGKSTTIPLHRFLFFPDGSRLTVDHKMTGKTLDCRRNNLRVADYSQQNANRGLSRANTSGFKGVSFAPRMKNKWKASIGHNNEKHNLGYFETKEKAHAAYCEAAVRMHGEFANFGIKAQKESK